MFKITGTNISLTRGDTFIAEVEITRNGEKYTPTAEDRVRFAMKHLSFNAARSEFTDEAPLILKEIQNGILRLEPSDTKYFGFGVYAYDIEITFGDDTVDTFIYGRLTLTPEVE